MSNTLPDPSTPFGAKVAQRLRDEQIIWLTAVDASGTPQPNPVWFYWDGEAAFVYNQPGTKRLPHIARNPKVALHFNTDADGGEVVIFTGEARVVPEGSPAAVQDGYRRKYAAGIQSIGHTWESMQAAYSITLRITLTKTRGF